MTKQKTKLGRPPKKQYPVERAEVPGANNSSTRCKPVIKTKATLLYREFLVEKIIARQVKSQGIQYLVKWVGYTEPNWEPARNLFKCTVLIKQFEAKLNAGRRPEVEQLSSLNSPIKTRLMVQLEEMQKRPPYNITGGKQRNGKLFFLVQWQKADIGREEVPAQVMHAMWPLLVVRFLEQRIEWKNTGIEVEMGEGREPGKSKDKNEEEGPGQGENIQEEAAKAQEVEAVGEILDQVEIEENKQVGNE